MSYTFWVSCVTLLTDPEETSMLRTSRALAEVGLALLPHVPAPRPHRAADVSPEWLTATLGARAPGARVEAVEPVGGTTGTTDRQQLRATWNERGTAAGLPRDLFVKSTPLSGKNRAMVAALDMAVNEVAFFQHARPDLGEHDAPVVRHAHAGHGARHLIVMDDIAADGGELFALADDCDLGHAQGVIEALARLHAAFWESPRFGTDLRFARTIFDRPGFGLLRLQFRKVRNALVGSDEHDLPSGVHRMIEIVNANDRALYRRWEEGSQTLIHGDSHLGNTFRDGTGRSGLLDWQVVGQAPGLREVSYFLTHSIPTALRRAHEDDLVRLYLDVLAAAGVTNPASYDEAWTAIRHFSFDAWDSAAICVTWPGLQAPANVEAGFRRANVTVEDWEVDKALRAYLG